MQSQSSNNLKDLAQRLAAIKTTIADACVRAGRSANDVTLVAVSKGQDFAAIKAAYDGGQRIFGENYPQELADKMALAEQAGITDIAWHFIGAMQTNKLKIIKRADVVQSVDSLAHARALAQMLDKPKPIFLQINLDGHPRRHGFIAEDLVRDAHEICALNKLQIMGLMAILPFETDKPPAFWFEKMVELKVRLHGSLENVALSMGMSDDFVEAILFGANFVRIGTKIFGARK